MGYFIFGLADVAFFISLIVTVYFGFRSKKNKEAYRDKFNHSIIAAFVFFILLLASSSLMPDTSSDESASKPKEEKVQSSSSSEEETQSSSEEENDDDQLTASQVTKINKQLVANLEDDQNDAKGGNKNSDWSNYVLKIVINQNWQATVYVDGSFVDLNEDARNEVASRTNGLIGRSIVIAGVDYSPERSREGIYMNFHNGPDILGRSRFTDHTSIKWNK